MAKIHHNGGIAEATLELGFDIVKYFEGTVNSTATTVNISRPARRLVVVNLSTTEDVYVRIDGSTAEVPSLSDFELSDNIKVRPAATFTMDFDSLTSFSLICSSIAAVEGLLGFKGNS